MGELLLLCVEKHLNNHTFVNHMSYSLLSLETQKTRATFPTLFTHTQYKNFLTNLDRFSPEGSGFVKRSAGFSLPSTLESASWPELTACWIRKLDVAMWRMRPAPLRPAIPRHAVESTRRLIGFTGRDFHICHQSHHTYGYACLLDRGVKLGLSAG